MKSSFIRILMIVALAAGGMVAFWGVASAVDDKGGDHTEAENCGGCHFNPKMAEVVEQWEESQHGNSYDGGSGANTYCASCKSSFLADPNATYSNNEEIPQEEWQDVTCSACHPPHDLRVEWGTPIGTYDVASAEWSPVYDSNELCVSCHTGSHHAKDYKGFGQSMYDKKGVKCNDCHMAQVPSEAVEEDVIHTHSWEVEANLPYSCGLQDGGCHDNHSTKWAEKQINKGKIHGTGGKNPDNWPYYPGGESPP